MKKEEPRQMPLARALCAGMADEMRGGVVQSEGVKNGDSFCKGLCRAKTGDIFTSGAL
jgi:hypothetical protein